MPYSPFYPGGWKDWPDPSTPISAAALTHLESGIAAGGGSVEITDGTHTVAAATELNFTSGATVTDAGGGVANVSIPTASGFMTVTGGGNETVDTVGTSGSSLTVDLTNGNVYDVTLTANCTLTLAGATNSKGDTLTLLLRQDVTGGRTVTWPGSVTWVGATAPILQTSGSAVDIITLFTVNGGTNWYGIFGTPFKAIGANAYSTTTQAITTATWTSVALAGENWDTATLHDTVTNNSRITVPVSGKYQCNWRCQFANAAGGTLGRYIAFGKNGTVDPHSMGTFAFSNSWNTGMVASEVLNLSANDYVEGFVYQDSGGNLNTQAGATLSVAFVGS